MREQGEALERLGAVVLVVTFEPPSEAARFAQQARLPFTMLSDPDRRAYAAFGLRRGRWGQVWGWNTATAYLRGLLAGRWPRPPRGDLGQLGGDFVLDREGRLVFAHCGRDPADRPAVGQLLAALRTVAGRGD